MQPQIFAARAFFLPRFSERSQILLPVARRLLCILQAQDFEITPRGCLRRIAIDGGRQISSASPAIRPRERATTFRGRRSPENLRQREPVQDKATPTNVNPNTGTVKTAQKNRGGVATAHTANGAAVVNPHTGNAAVAQTNQSGVTSTQTTNGGKAKTKNGKRIYVAPNGMACVEDRRW